jgi:hypothetical protein
MSDKKINLIAVFLLLFMFMVAILSMNGDSLTMDELAHIPSGYSYLTQRDMRLNPEHPPLLKDWAAIPLVFMSLKFDTGFGAWKDDVNGQWSMGWKFIFNSGNNPAKIIFWSRIPMILILMLMGFYVFHWAKELFGKKIALFTLFLFSFSPTFIAHGRYVTTDVGAAAAFFIATYYFIKWLKDANKKNLIIAGVVFGIAQLIKFSLFLLIPYFGLLLLVWIYIKWREGNKLFKVFIVHCLKFIVVLIIGYIIVYPIYQYHVLNYPPERQVRDAEFITRSFMIRPIANLIVWMSDKPILRAYGQYLFGLSMVFQRATGGNTTFFLGEVSGAGWKNYFPVVYAIKEPLALHIFTILVLLFLASQGNKEFWKKIFSSLSKILKENFPEIAMLIFLAIYWLFTLLSNLNIGVRHILPTLPFVYLLISGQIKRMSERVKGKKKLFIGYWSLVVFLMLWYALSSLSVFPYYLTHFNELVGGPKNGYLYVTDSNLDWGQDLKRLAKWVDEQEIKKIKVDYFGGSDTRYYLGDKFEPWHGDWKPENAKGSWLAISATFLQQGRAEPAPGFDQPTDYYLWLNQYQPVTVIGNSIFVYYIPE